MLAKVRSALILDCSLCYVTLESCYYGHYNCLTHTHEDKVIFPVHVIREGGTFTNILEQQNSCKKCIFVAKYNLMLQGQDVPEFLWQRL